MARASVAIILRKNKTCGFDILLIKRAERSGDPWSGDMAFPGGKMDSTDQNIYHTALRELQEEIGLEARYLKQLGRLSDQITKTHSGLRPMIISAFIFELSKQADFVLNHEVAEIVWIPLTHFSTSTNRKQMVWKVKGLKINLPCYWFNNKRVWGLTLRMLDELVANE
jgi:8-oxo-dGTP pyrophosphatase MutT (NUDIX family)